jgi:hypothetical protein
MCIGTVLSSEITVRECRPCWTMGKATWAGAIARVPVQLPGVRDLWHVHTLHEREPGDLGSGCYLEGSPAGEGQGRNPGVYTSEKSDRLIVPEKPSNKAPSIPITRDHGAAETVEERGLAKGNLLKFDRCRTL